MIRRTRVPVFAISAVVLAAAGLGCAPEATDRNLADTWVGTITGEGNVTTVINESGSVWGGSRELAEDLSIGVEAGPDEYMLGRVADIAADNAHVYALEPRAELQVHVYDRQGTHVASFGRLGEGPGELEWPVDLAVGDDGQVFVRDPAAGRISVCEADGTVLDTWQTASGSGARQARMVVGPDGRLYVPVRQLRPRQPIPQIAIHGPDGTLLDERIELPHTSFEPMELEGLGGRTVSPVPYRPDIAFTMTREGALVTGISDNYDFEIRRANGSVVKVSRQVEPVPVQPGEAEWQASLVRRFMVMNQPDWTWVGPEIPAVKPAFERIHVARDGRIWLQRLGAGRQQPDCDPEAADRDNPCWRETTFYDVFDAEGRFLGSVDLPDVFPACPGYATCVQPAFVDDSLYQVVEDDAGTILVKRYRLVPPGAL